MGGRKDKGKAKVDPREEERRRRLAEQERDRQRIEDRRLTVQNEPIPPEVVEAYVRENFADLVVPAQHPPQTYFSMEDIFAGLDADGNPLDDVTRLSSDHGRRRSGEEEETQQRVPSEMGQNDEERPQASSQSSGQHAGGPNIPVPRIRLRRGRRQPSGSGYTVRIRNFQGEERTRTLTVPQVHHLPDNERVVLEYFDRTGQPTGEEAQLFSRFCLDIGKRSYDIFPIDAKSWKKIPRHSRDYVWEGQVKKKFWADDRCKVVGVGKIGEGWKDQRNQFYNARNPYGNTPEHEIAANVPDGVLPAPWARYVAWRHGFEGQERSRKGKEARQLQTIRHSAGSRLFAVGLAEMLKEALEQGIPVEQVVNDFYIETHRRADGTPLSQDAEAAIARHDEAVRRVATQATQETTQGQPPDDAFTVLAKIRTAMGVVEHAGRVGGLGFGARPTQVYGPRSTQGAAGPSQSWESRLEEERRAREEAERLAAFREENERLERQRREIADQGAQLDRKREEVARMMEEIQRLRDEVVARDPARRRRRSPQGSSDDEDDDE